MPSESRAWRRLHAALRLACLQPLFGWSNCAQRCRKRFLLERGASNARAGCLRTHLQSTIASVSLSLASCAFVVAFVSFVVPLITRRERHSSFVAVAHANHPSFIC